MQAFIAKHWKPLLLVVAGAVATYFGGASAGVAIQEILKSILGG